MAQLEEQVKEVLNPYIVQIHTPYAGALPRGREPSEEEVRLALTRHGRPSWTEEDFQGLIRQLQYAGYGWLRREGVRAELERMARGWEGPPPSPFGSHAS